MSEKVQDDRMQLWLGMPEYKQEKILPHKELIVRFRTEDDLLNFFNLIGQNPPQKLKSFWFPQKKPSRINAFWVDGEED